MNELDTKNLQNLHLMSSYETIENIKRQENVQRGTFSIPIIVSFRNLGKDTIKNIKLDMNSDIDLTANNKDVQFKFEFKEISLDSMILPSQGTIGITLFDISGFKIAKLGIQHLSYDRNGKQMYAYRINAPIIFETSRLINNYNGFGSKEEFETWYFLDNYASTAISSRSILLKFMFDKLQELESGELKVAGESITLGNAAKLSLKNIIQIDIISKIMMFIEDLIVILESMVSFNGRYYDILDRKETDGSDLGDKITRFMNGIDKFSEEDFRNMLSYVDIKDLPNYQGKDIVEKIIKMNIQRVLVLLKHIKDFRRTHNQVFRRYKHAGFAFRTNVEANLYVDNKSYDSFFMVYHEQENPLSNPLPIPLSSEVLESYKCLISSLETLIYDVIEGKKACIERRIYKIPPLFRYSNEGLTESEIHLVEKVIENFFKQNPLYAFNSSFKFKGKVKRENIPWYLDIETFMKECKSNRTIRLTEELHGSTQNAE